MLAPLFKMIFTGKDDCRRHRKGFVCTDCCHNAEAFLVVTLQLHLLTLSDRPNYVLPPTAPINHNGSLVHCKLEFRLDMMVSLNLNESIEVIFEICRI